VSITLASLTIFVTGLGVVLFIGVVIFTLIGIGNAL
jgi:hypothetical protein